MADEQIAAKSEEISEYMIAELQMLQQRASQHEQSVTRRSNFYVTSLSLIVGVMLIVAEKQILNPMLLPLMIITLGFFAVLGFVILSQVLDSYISSVFLYIQGDEFR